MNRLAVINVVGLTEALIGDKTPRIAGLSKPEALTQISPAFPAGGSAFLETIQPHCPKRKNMGRA
jgi:hypothetical protein